MAVVREITEFEPGRPFIGENLSIYNQGDVLAVNIGESTSIRVETPKKPGQPWDQKAREDIEIARVSYRVTWGDVPAWDESDRKPLTYNYIAYVHYPSPTGEGEASEAISNRMVLEKPEDLEFYVMDGRPLKDALVESLYTSQGLDARVIAGESRIGAIRPPHSRSNEKTLEAFAAIKLQMVRDARARGVEYIACQLKPELPTSVLRVNGFFYEFPRTEAVVGFPTGSVRLNRNNLAVARHILKYPGFFLDNDGVFNVIKDIIEEGELTEEDFRSKTGLDSVEDLRLSVRNIKEIAPLLDSEMPTGAGLRSRLLREVADGAYSSISHVDTIESRALSILQDVASYELTMVR